MEDGKRNRPFSQGLVVRLALDVNARRGDRECLFSWDLAAESSLGKLRTMFTSCSMARIHGSLQSTMTKTSRQTERRERSIPGVKARTGIFLWIYEIATPVIKMRCKMTIMNFDYSDYKMCPRESIEIAEDLRVRIFLWSIQTYFKC